MFFAICAPAAESLSKAQKDEVLKVLDKAKKAFLEKNHSAFVELLYPEMVKAMGGKERVTQMLKDEDAKQTAAGLVIESIVLQPSDTVYTGTEFRLSFATSVVVAKLGETRLESKSYYLVFSSLKGGPWYLLDGTRLSMPQFRSVFSGFPADLKFPAVEKKQL